MSRANRIGKELARQRAALMRVEQARRGERNRRTAVYGSSLGVVLLAIVLGIVITGAVQPFEPAAVPSKTVADTSGGITSANGMAIPIGDAAAPVKLTVYEDVRCSACGQFESQYQSAYKALVKAGTVELLVHLVDLIDNSDGGTGSLAAGNALACAQNAGHFEDYHDLLYSNQPAESTDSYSSTSTLIDYAKKVSGLDSATFESCVKSGRYDGWIKQNYRDLEQIDGVANTSTPTLLANGTKLTLSTPAAFTTQMQQLAAKASPSASASGSAAASSTAAPSAAATSSASGSASPSPSAS